MGPRGGADPVSALCALLAPGAPLSAACRYCYELRLHRARGYGALKAILDVLAEQEPLTLTEIALRLRRTPGSTKDYLSWLEDVDLIASRQKRYSFADPLLRVWVRLHCRPMPPVRRGHRPRSPRLRHGPAAGRPSRRSPSPALPAPRPARRAGASSRLIEDGQGRLRGGLRRFLLARPRRPRQRLPVHHHFDLEPPPVRRADLGGQPIRGQSALA